MTPAALRRTCLARPGAGEPFPRPGELGHRGLRAASSHSAGRLARRPQLAQVIEQRIPETLERMSHVGDLARLPPQQAPLETTIDLDGSMPDATVRDMSVDSCNLIVVPGAARSRPASAGLDRRLNG